jgi:hypothetical protein
MTDWQIFWQMLGNCAKILCCAESHMKQLLPATRETRRPLNGRKIQSCQAIKKAWTCKVLWHGLAITSYRYSQLETFLRRLRMSMCPRCNENHYDQRKSHSCCTSCNYSPEPPSFRRDRYRSNRILSQFFPCHYRDSVQCDWDIERELRLMRVP